MLESFTIYNNLITKGEYLLNRVNLDFSAFWLFYSNPGKFLWFIFTKLPCIDITSSFI